VTEPIRVLVVDDSAFVRRAVERMLGGVQGLVVVGTAADGTDAVERVKELRPHVVIMDVNMPEMNGLEALRRIMAEAPTRVLMMSTLTREGADTTMKALDLGAVDFIDKSAAGTTMDIYSLGPLLREKVLAVAGATVPPPAAENEPPAPVRVPEPLTHSPREHDVVLIGASTGGPRALAEVLSRLPEDFPVGVVVAQHMPAGFTLTLAERLNRRCRLHVVEAQDGTPIEPGRVLIAPGGKQITLRRSDRELCVGVDPGPTNLIHRPSVDLLFQSAARLIGARAVGVVLTGMGDDGARGLAELRAAGARTVVESSETAVIYGMPRAAAPSAERILPLREIGPALVEIGMGIGAAQREERA
jgi:two-component system, chemotaxis family, protein-glutamate methylesterase/glutaminase